MLPEDLRPDYEPFFDHSGEDPELLKLLKAADKISALIKCVEEENSGNREFSKAKISIMESIEKMGAWVNTLTQGRKVPRFYIQPFADRDTVLFSGLSAPSKDTMDGFCRILTPYTSYVSIRG